MGLGADPNETTTLFRVKGIPNEDGEFPILDGEGKLTEGVIASSNNFYICRYPHGDFHTQFNQWISVEYCLGIAWH